ncbi:MAG: hypothetical protein K5666_04740 [Bacilli bacterium]|nr:hypothetical protein [Bacilli bacterium]
MQKYKSRQDVPTEYKWNLEDIFKDLDEYNKSFEEVKNWIENLSSFVGCTKDSDKLYEFLNYDVKLSALLLRVVIYAYVINDQELGISDNMDRLAKTEELEMKYSSATSFFAPELLELTKDEYDKLFNNDKLLEFKSELDNIYRAKEHIIPSDKEIIINNMSNAAPNYENLSQTLLNSLHDYGTVNIDGEEEKILQTNLRRLLKNDNKEIRKEVREKYNKVIKQYDTVNASLLNSFVKTCLTGAGMHNYKDSWDAKLFNNKMPNEAYMALVNAVEGNVDKLQKYFKVFKDTLKLDTLDMCDLNLEMVKLDKEYSIEEAQELCLNAIKPLGEDYYKHFKKIFDNHYIDYACYPSKCSGGYSISGLDFDSRILLSYNYDLSSVSTIIHEGGHNVHHQYISENNPLQYRDMPSLIAEVASLTNECLLSSYLVNNGKTKEERLKGIENILDVIVSNLFGAVREGKMEQDFYNYVKEGNNITSDYMTDLTKSYIDKYYGDVVPSFLL